METTVSEKEDPVFHRRMLETNLVSGRFVEDYYLYLDQARSELCHYYLPESVLAWNGNAVVGGDAICEFFTQLPLTQHQIYQFDAQFISDVEKSVLIIVHGEVSYPDDKKRKFSHQFIIMVVSDGLDQVQYAIIHETYRTLGAVTPVSSKPRYMSSSSGVSSFASSSSSSSPSAGGTSASPSMSSEMDMHADSESSHRGSFRGRNSRGRRPYRHPRAHRPQY